MRVILLLFLVSSFSYSLKIKESQSKLLTEVYKIGLELNDNPYSLNMSTILCVLVLNESFKDEAVIGDNIEHSLFIYKKDMHTEEIKKIYVPKELIHKEDNVYYLYDKDTKYLVHAEKTKKRMIESSLSPFQIRINTAKSMIRLYHSEYKDLLTNDEKLIAKLILDLEFAAKIAASYIFHNYKIALDRNYEKPFYNTISAYNGGWENDAYYSKFLENLNWLENNAKSIIAL